MAGNRRLNRVVKESLTKEDRERALLALIHEGRRMPPSRTELAAKIAEMRGGGDRERSKASKTPRR